MLFLFYFKPDGKRKHQMNINNGDVIIELLYAGLVFFILKNRKL